MRAQPNELFVASENKRTDGCPIPVSDAAFCHKQLDNEVQRRRSFDLSTITFLRAAGEPRTIALRIIGSGPALFCRRHSGNAEPRLQIGERKPRARVRGVAL